MKIPFILGVLIMGADSQQPDLSLQPSPLDGSWDLVSVTCGPGMLVLPIQRWSFFGTQWNYHGSNFKGHGTCKFGFRNNLHTVDIAESTFGKCKLCAIWKIQDEKLVICYVLNGDDRPSNFKEKGVILTFKRVAGP